MKKSEIIEGLIQTIQSQKQTADAMINKMRQIPELVEALELVQAHQRDLMPLPESVCSAVDKTLENHKAGRE